MKVDGSAFGVAGTKNSPGIRRGSPLTRSAADECRSSLKAVRMPRRTSHRASVHCSSAWYTMAAFSVQCSRSTRPLAAGW